MPDGLTLYRAQEDELNEAVLLHKKRADAVKMKIEREWSQAGYR